MKHSNSNLKWYLLAAIFLVILSFLIYSAQVIIFGRPDETMFYFFQDMSFVPLQVLFVTFVIDRLLQRQQRIIQKKRVYVSIGIFFSEVGNDFIMHMRPHTVDADKLANLLGISGTWKARDFETAAAALGNFRLSVELNPSFLAELSCFLSEKKQYILELLGNPNLVEHESFTDTMLAVYHMADEFSRRNSFSDLPEADIDHLKKDIIRAYHAVAVEWIAYMSHLKDQYPFLFSLANRSNPFKKDTDPVIYG